MNFSKRLSIDFDCMRNPLIWATYVSLYSAANVFDFYGVCVFCMDCVLLCLFRSILCGFSLIVFGSHVSNVYFIRV